MSLVGAERREGLADVENGEGETFRASPEGRESEGLVRIEARTGRENLGLRERRDNGSNELTRTPEPRSSLSSRFRLALLLALSLSLYHAVGLSSRLFWSVFLSTLLPPDVPLSPCPSAPLNESPSTLSTHPPLTLPSLLSLASLSLSPYLSVPSPPSPLVRHLCCTRTPSHAVSVHPAPSRAGLGAANYPGHIGTFYPRNKDGKSDYYENKST